MTKSLEDVNKNPNILSQTNLTYMWRDSMCDPHQALAGAVDLYNAGVNVIIGPVCSSACNAVGYLSTGRSLLVYPRCLFYYITLKNSVRL